MSIKGQTYSKISRAKIIAVLSLNHSSREGLHCLLPRVSSWHVLLKIASTHGSVLIAFFFWPNGEERSHNKTLTISTARCCPGRICCRRLSIRWRKNLNVPSACPFSPILFRCHAAISSAALVWTRLVTFSTCPVVVLLVVWIGPVFFLLLYVCRYRIVLPFLHTGSQLEQAVSSLQIEIHPS